LAHGLDHVAVADVRAHELDALGLEGALEAEVSQLRVITDTLRRTLG
jgi:hypothetical protein